MSGLDRMLQSHNFDIWAADAEEEADVVGETIGALKSMSAEFQGLAKRLDAQAQNGTSTNEQLATLNKTIAALLASQAATQKNILELGRALGEIGRVLQAPKRLIKDANGKPVGVEVMT